MISKHREAFNRNFSEKKYRDFLAGLGKGFPEIPFRVAETPVFIPAELSAKLMLAGAEIISLIKQADFKRLTDKAIPAEWKVPGENDHPHFLAFDFGICKDDAGMLVPKLIEMQGFPSLYGFQLHMAEHYKEAYNLDAQLTPLFRGYTPATYIELLKQVILGDCALHEVALMDVDAHEQKTAIDFYLTEKYLGIKVLALTDIFKEGKSLFYLENGNKIKLKRIYNRLIFDEVNGRTDLFKQSFDPREELEVEWITHPNWFYRISKYTMPFLQSDFVPETIFLNQVTDIPVDLENYVLKPLFSFAGTGVMIDVRREDLEAIKDPENWILQRKVAYEPVVQSPNGGVKVEIRLLYLWPDGEEPKLCINLARLSKGKMIGVRYNKDFDWVGGTVGLMDG